MHKVFSSWKSTTRRSAATCSIHSLFIVYSYPFPAGRAATNNHPAIRLIMSSSCRGTGNLGSIGGSSANQSSNNNSIRNSLEREEFENNGRLTRPGTLGQPSVNETSLNTLLSPYLSNNSARWEQYRPIILSRDESTSRNLQREQTILTANAELADIMTQALDLIENHRVSQGVRSHQLRSLPVSRDFPKQ